MSGEIVVGDSSRGKSALVSVPEARQLFADEIPFNEGYLAHERGAWNDDNPYPVGSPECNLWIEGWIAAKAEKEARAGR